MDACVNLINYNDSLGSDGVFQKNQQFHFYSYLGLADGGNERKSFGATEVNLCDTWADHCQSL